MNALPAERPASFFCTIFRNNKGMVINAARDMDLRELERVITAAPVVRDKDSQPLLKLARFGELKTIKGSLRHDPNVIAVAGIEGDYDGEQMPMQHAADSLSAFGIGALLYSTASSTPDAPRWRVIVPLANALEGTEAELRAQREHWVGVLNAVLGGVLKSESFVLSQGFYFGRVANAPTPDVIRMEGACIDQLEEPPEPIIASGVTTDTATRKERDEKAFAGLTAIMDADHIYNTTRDYAARLVAKGFPPDEALVLLRGFLLGHRDAWNTDEQQRARFDEVMQKLPRMIEGAEQFAPPKQDGSASLPTQTDRRSIALKDIEPVLTVDSEIKGVLGRRCVGAVIAESGAGKSYSVQYMGAHASKGLRWHNRRTQPGVWWFCLREGFDAAKNRFAGMKREHPELADAPLELDPDGVSLNDPVSCLAFVDRVRKRATELGIRIAVIVIDTLAWAMPGGSENDPKDMGLALDGARSIRDALNVTVLLIHHLGKDTSKGARGHSSFKAALDTELTIEKRGDVRVISASKQRDYESDNEIASFKLRQIVLGQDQDGEDVTTCVVDPVALTDVPVPIKKPTGKNQKSLLAELERRADEAIKAGTAYAWTETDLRRVCKDIGMGRQTDRDAVLGLRQMGYFTPTIGGDRLTHKPFTSETQK